MSAATPTPPGGPAEGPTPTPPRSLALDLPRLARLARKELSESLRDRRTVVTLLLMPALLYPLLAIGFLQIRPSAGAKQEGPVYRLGFLPRPENEEFDPGPLRMPGDRRVTHREVEVFSYLHSLGVRGLRGQEGKGPKTDGENVPAVLAPLPRLMFLPSTDPEDSARRDEVDVAVRLQGVDYGRTVLGQSITCTLSFREDSPVGRAAARHLALTLQSSNVEVMRLEERHLRKLLGPPAGPPHFRPVRVRSAALPAVEAQSASLLPVFIPLILILMTITGAVYPAIDLTAGERERGTLEILVAAPIPRMGVLFAKYVAVLTVAVLTALVNMTAMTVTLSVTGIGQAVFGGGLTLLALVQMLALLLLFAAFFSAVLLALTSFARSFKEAQAYLVPLMLVALTPGMLALIPGLELRGALAIAPLINVVLLGRDLFQGTASLGTALVVVATTLLYALAALALAARIFGTEAVLSETSGWGDLLRRATHPEATASPSAALLCLAFMFPLYFLLVTGLSRFDLAVPAKLALSALANAVLFLAFPLASVWLGRVRLRSGLRLRKPPALAWVVAVLLGLSLWPFAPELALLLRKAGFSSLSPEVKSQLSEFATAWREVPLPLILVTLGLLPPVLEELFFRGYLFSALAREGTRAAPVILGTAALFALFHLLVAGALVLDRLPISFLLGAVLGWLTWRSGSVLPAMLMHALHNGVIVALAYYQPELGTSDDHLPLWVLGPAGVAVGVAAGLGLLGLSRLRPQEVADHA